MLNIIYIYIYEAVGSVAHRNAKSTTARRTGRRRNLKIASDHRAMHLRWSSVGCGSDRCRPVLSAAGSI